MTTVRPLTIDGSTLRIADPGLISANVADPGSDLVYTLTTLPQHGTLTVDGTTLALNGQFTQDQIDQGLVVYNNDSSGAESDSFSFSMSDTVFHHDLGAVTIDVSRAGFDMSVYDQAFTGGADPVIYFPGSLRSTFTGGTDTTVSYALAPAAVDISLNPSSGTLINIQGVIGSPFDDVFFSGPGTYLIAGGGGNDTIIGDAIVGQPGNDTAAYSGARSDYLVTGFTGDLKITDLRPGSPDGTDFVTGIDSFQFSDGTYTTVQLDPINEIEGNGATALAVVGADYYLYDNHFLHLDGAATATGPELTYHGVPFTNQWFDWMPIGAEATATGYEVAFHLAFTNLYTVWNTDANGSIIANPIGTVSGNSLTLEALETSFHQDLNNDGIIGLPSGDTLIEAIGSTSLIQTGSNYVLDKAGGGAELQYDGAAFTAGQFGGWTPIGVEATATGYEVAFKVAGADLYTVWDTDANGNIIINPTGTVSGESPTLIALEKGFQQDLNGDGMIGNPATPIAVESFGSTSLVLTGNDYFLDPIGTSNGPLLKYDGAAWTDGEWGGWTPIAAEATAGGHEVAFNLSGTNQYTVWNTDANGNITTDTIGTVTGNSATLEGLETSFHQDLNGDGIIGDPSVPFAIETSGSTSLTQLGHDFFLYAHGTSNGPELKYDGAAWTNGVWGGWTPIGAEAIAGGGYEVAFKLTGADLYTVWNTDSNGNVTTNPISSVPGSASSLQSIETSFQQDLNGDGVVGPPSHTSAASSDSSSAGSATITLASSGFQLSFIDINAANAFNVTLKAAPIVAPDSGDTVLAGTAASDTFLFNAHFGNDTVTGFQPGVDQVNLDHTLFASVADLLAHTADNAAGSAVASVGAGQSITFDDVSKLVLQQHASDFHLV